MEQTPVIIDVLARGSARSWARGTEGSRPVLGGPDVELSVCLARCHEDMDTHCGQVEGGHSRASGSLVAYRWAGRVLRVLWSGRDVPDRFVTDTVLAGIGNDVRTPTVCARNLLPVSRMGEQKATRLTSEETELPASIGKVARRELAVHGLTQYAQLADRSERDLLDIHGVGPKAIRILREELRSKGLSFREE